MSSIEYLPPAGRIVSAERDFSPNRADSCWVHSDHVEIEVEEVLEPHSGDHQQPPLGIRVVLGVPIRRIASEPRQEVFEKSRQVGRSKTVRCPRPVEVPENRKQEPSLDPCRASAVVGDVYQVGEQSAPR